MIVILEGPDGAGKTTMAQEIARVHVEAGHAPESVAHWHAGPFPPDSDAWREYVLPLTSLSVSKEWLVIIDRWHLGELVYGPIFRGVSRLSLDQRTWIEGYLKTLGTVMIHLTATHDELVRRITERGDDMVKTEHLQPILDGYAALIADGHQPRVFARQYDTTGNKTGPTAASIYEVLKMEVAIALSRSRHPSEDHRPYWEKYSWPS